jgi:HD superfamily phosphohydrolase
MLKTHDRLYGTIELPDLAKELAETCPVLLRLREIRMANIPFFTYPSFANVDRYEHSLGVAHLAWRWAKRNRLPKDLGTALTIAALYHDGATPAYGHLFEEFLGRYGFDHEKALVNVLLGMPDELPGRENVQIFLGLHCRLREVLPAASHPSSPLTPLAIADLAAGKGPLGRLVKGDIDFDNIDNVIRACTSMGLIETKNMVHPYEIIDALTIEDNEVRLNPDYLFTISLWKAARRLLYDSINNNAHEFRAQTAIKWAIEECTKNDEDLAKASAWRLTEPVLTFEHLRKNPFSRMLVDRVRIGKPPELLFTAWVEDLTPFFGEQSEQTIRDLCEQISALSNMEVYVNYYIDKRERAIQIKPSQLNSLLSTDSHLKACNEKEIIKGTASGIMGLVAMSRIERSKHLPISTDHAWLSRRPLGKS